MKELRNYLTACHNTYSTEHNITNEKQLCQSLTTTQFVYCSVVLITRNCDRTCWWQRCMMDIYVTICCRLNGFLWLLLLKFHTDIIIINNNDKHYCLLLLSFTASNYWQAYLTRK